MWSHRCARMGLGQDRQLCLRLSVRWCALSGARGGCASPVSLQWRQVSTSACTSSTRGRGGTKRGLRRCRAVDLRAQRAKCIQREVLWLLGREMQGMCLTTGVSNWKLISHQICICLLQFTLIIMFIMYLCVCFLSNLRDSCLRVGLAHVDGHSVRVGGKLLHKLRLICWLRHHVPSVRSHHALCRRHPCGWHANLSEKEKLDIWLHAHLPNVERINNRT